MGSKHAALPFHLGGGVNRYEKRNAPARIFEALDVGDIAAGIAIVCGEPWSVRLPGFANGIGWLRWSGRGWIPPIPDRLNDVWRRKRPEGR